MENKLKCWLIGVGWRWWPAVPIAASAVVSVGWAAALAIALVVDRLALTQIAFLAGMAAKPDTDTPSMLRKDDEPRTLFGAARYWESRAVGAERLLRQLRIVTFATGVLAGAIAAGAIVRGLWH